MTAFAFGRLIAFVPNRAFVQNGNLRLLKNALVYHFEHTITQFLEGNTFDMK
jgi:hypothetical protein